MADNKSGAADFDFFVGHWQANHRRHKGRLLDGSAHLDDNVLELPEGAYRAVVLRAYDSNTRKQLPQ